jgi:hypothetical protein
LEKTGECKKERGRTMELKSLCFLIVLLLAMPSLSEAWSYPRDGKFKQLHPHAAALYRLLCYPETLVQAHE